MMRTGPLPYLVALGLLGLLAAPLAAQVEVDGFEDRRKLRLEAIDLPDGAEDPRALTPAMKKWAVANVARSFSDRQTLIHLLRALQSNRLGLEYDNSYTGTAIEVFETRKFNCLSFAHLFVALARNIGIRVEYYGIERPVSYDREGNLILVAEHVTATHGSGPAQLTLEFAVEGDVDYRRGRRLADARALALHFSNRAAEILVQGDVPGALRASQVATSLDPELASAWVNLGVIRRRSGDVAGAEAAYREALEQDFDHYPAYHNLHALLLGTGRDDTAAEMMELLDRRSNRNPFTFLQLGDVSRRSGHLEEAHRFYRRALSLNGATADGRAAMGLLALARGEVNDARRWLSRAEAAADTGNWRVQELAESLDRLEPSEGGQLTSNRGASR